MESSKRQQRSEEVDEEELLLRNAIFGSGEWMTESADKESSTVVTSASSDAPDESLFFVDDKGESGGAAWVDSDDENITVDLAGTNRLRKLRTTETDTVVSGAELSERLRAQHAKLAPSTVSWATKKGNRGRQDEEEAALTQTTSVLDKQPKSRVRDELASGHVRVRNLREVSEKGECVVQALDWNSSATDVFLTGGLDKTLRLFQLSGRKDNKLLRSVCFADLPIMSAEFVGPSSVVVAGRRPFYFAYDVESGALERVQGVVGRKEQKSFEKFVSKQGLLAFLLTDGFISLVSTHSKLEVGCCRSGSQVTSARFVGDHQLISGGSDGEVFLWDIRKLRIPVWRRQDEGSMRVTSLASSGEVYAVGSNSGVVNLYSTESGAKVKSVMNLTTWIDSLDFSPDGSVLAMASRDKRDALKLFSLPSNSVVSNWPERTTKLGKVQRTVWSKRGGVLSVGNDRGEVLLWRVQGVE